MPDLAIRTIRPGEEAAVARLLYLSAAGMYDMYAGGPERALAVLRRALARPGTSASAEVVLVAELDGNPAGAMAAFPISEAVPRARRFLRLTLALLPAWRWPAAIRLYRLGGRLTPAPPPGCFYVDALATDPGARRRGAARALLAAAEQRAREAGLPSLALDTALDNRDARALYEAFGFEAGERIGPRSGLPGFVGYVKPLER